MAGCMVGGRAIAIRSHRRHGNHLGCNVDVCACMFMHAAVVASLEIASIVDVRSARDPDFETVWRRTVAGKRQGNRRRQDTQQIEQRHRRASSQPPCPGEAYQQSSQPAPTNQPHIRCDGGISKAKQTTRSFGP
jgi:hypothetical protein